MGGIHAFDSSFVMYVSSLLIHSSFLASGLLLSRLFLNVPSCIHISAHQHEIFSFVRVLEMPQVVFVLLCPLVLTAVLMLTVFSMCLCPFYLPSVSL